MLFAIRQQDIASRLHYSEREDRALAVYSHTLGKLGTEKKSQIWKVMIGGIRARTTVTLPDRQDVLARITPH
jgi:hypothetical protein